MNEVEQKNKKLYHARIEMTVSYMADEAPDEDHVISPILRFMRKTAKTYKGRVIDIMGRVSEDNFPIGDDEEDE